MRDLATMARQDLRADMLSRTFANLTTGCWEWKGPLDRDGYGRMTVSIDGRPRKMSTHRLGFYVDSGCFVLRPLVVAHKCGNRRCWNPDHLEAITQGENIKWSWDAGRYGHRRKPHRLTETQVGSIRLLSRDQDLGGITLKLWPQRVLARTFNVSQGYINDILSGRRRAPKPAVNPQTQAQEAA
jgi:hypothetical protein